MFYLMKSCKLSQDESCMKDLFGVLKTSSNKSTQEALDEINLELDSDF